MDPPGGANAYPIARRICLEAATFRAPRLDHRESGDAGEHARCEVIGGQLCETEDLRAPRKTVPAEADQVTFAQRCELQRSAIARSVADEELTGEGVGS